MFSRASVCSHGVGWGWCLVRGGVWSGGYLVIEIGWVSGQRGARCLVKGVGSRTPPKMDTSAVGTHPTGMYRVNVLVLCISRQDFFSK